MKKFTLLTVLLSLSASLASCSSNNDNVITVCASESPHAEVLNNAVKPLLEEKGYTLKVTVLDWTIQNDAVKSKEYDANYFQHRPYLQQYDSGSSTYNENYTYTKVFPVVGVHFEPLRIYAGKKTAAEFESIKKTATYEICNDVSNEIRALDLLVACGALDSYETDSNGNPINLPSNITLIEESLLASSRNDYDYAVLPTNTALTAKITADTSLPTESESVKNLRANVLAANVSEYKSNTTYKAKIDALSDALLSSAVADYIKSEYNGVIEVVQSDLR